MKIEEAIQVLEKSISEGGNKQQIKIKQSLGNVLEELRYKPFNAAQKAELEESLEQLIVHIKADEGQLKKHYKVFLKMLNKRFSLVPEGYWAGNGLVYGMLGGTLLMAVSIPYTDSALKFYLPLGGMLLGMIIGSACDRVVKKKGRALLTKI